MEPNSEAFVVRGFEIFINVQNMLTISQTDDGETNVVCVEISQAETLIAGIRKVAQAAQEGGVCDD